MRVFKSSYRDRKGKTVRTDTWYVEFQDHKGDTRRVSAFTSKAASEELGRGLDKLSSYARATGGQIDPALQQWVAGLPRSLLQRLSKIGLLKSERLAVSKPLTEHLADYAAALSAKGNTAKHVNGVRGRVGRIFKECGFKYWDDLSASKVQKFLADLRENEEKDGETELGISAQTFNYYLGSLKAFCRWMMKDRRALSSPVGHLEILNVRTDRRHERRALAEDELRRLMKAAQAGGELFGHDREGIIAYRLSGADRAMLYRLAVETGLRAGEIRSLTPLSFDLDGDLATVKVLAAYSKHRRDDTLPLLASTAAMLREYLAERELDKPVFQLPRREELASILRVDLEAAGIPYRDAEGKVVDFHALRHTFITNLAQGGVHPKTAQALARHSTITLTMDRYSHSRREDEARALSALPDLSRSEADEEVPDLKNEPGNDGDVSADCLALQGHPSESNGHSGRLNGRAAGTKQAHTKQAKNRETEVAPVGFEPTRPITGQRILSPLRLPFRHGAAGRVYGQTSRTDGFGTLAERACPLRSAHARPA